MPPTKSPAQWFAEWDAWATQGPGEDRATAVDRMKAWLNEGLPSAALDLSALGLTELPDLPPTLQALDVSDNYLTSLPERLPDWLMQLNASDNQLGSLPEKLPHPLQELRLSGNQLTRLPENLPIPLQYLSVSDNLLISLPERLPPWLQVLDVSGNDLTSLPQVLPGLLTRLNASYNQLASLPLHMPDSLEHLNVNFNPLTSLPEDLPDSIKYIGLADCRLDSLPRKLPASLERLDLARNRLASLPENLPDSLKRLDASENRLTGLPQHLPGSLRDLDVGFNNLASLSENLPDSLERLNAPRNQLTGLPNRLPASLRQVALDHNQLAEFPAQITSMLQAGCAVDIRRNPFPERVITEVEAIINAEGYNGPAIQIATNRGVPPPPPGIVSSNSLDEAVAHWYGEDSESAKAVWSAFKDEGGATEFVRFLDRLRGTINYKSKEFKESVAEWLSHLAEYPQLREASFEISQGATASCDDRVSLTLNNMKKARLAADVERGDYDQRLDELVTLARGMFRLDKLEIIARQKTEALERAEVHGRHVDEVEVYLVYQVKLRDNLALPVATPEMQFDRLSQVTDVDLAKAESAVKELEDEEFIEYLSTHWSPWQSVLKRLYTTEYETARDNLVEGLSGKDFSEKVKARLAGTGVENDPDAQRNAASAIGNEMTLESNRELTLKFLEKQNLAHLLDPQWQE